MLGTYSEFLKDFDTTFPNGPCADVIDVERFINKYKILIERTTNTVIEELNMFNCVVVDCVIVLRKGKIQLLGKECGGWSVWYIIF